MFEKQLAVWRRISPGAKAILLFCMAFALYGYWHATPYFSDPDSLYHIQIAEIIATEGIPHEFPWMYFTQWREAFVDHHFLYHVLVAPFVIFLPDLFGMKLITVILAALVPTVLYILLNKYGSRFPWAFALFVAVSAPYAFRMNLAKASAFSLTMLILTTFIILWRKPVAAFILSFIYMWSYGGAPVAVAVAGLVFLVDLLLPTIQDRKNGTWKTRLWTAFKASYKTPLAVVLGITAGIVLSPFFPANLSFMWEQLIQIGIMNKGGEIGVGIEWYPYDPRAFLTGNSPLLVLTVPAAAFMILRYKKLDRETVVSFFLMLFFTAITIKSRRYIEYYVPFGYIYTAFALTAGLNTYKEQIDGWVRRIPTMEIPKKGLILLLVLYFVAFFAYVTYRGSNENSQTLAMRGTLDQFKGSGEWLEANVQPGDLVLQSSWDQFPVLFYQSHKPYYMGGLDPTFTYHYDKDVYWKWVDITMGKTRTDIGEQTKALGVKYVFATKSHVDMNRNYQQFTDFPIVYEDAEAYIYRVE